VKEYLKAIVIIIICLAVLLPLASTEPDGLEKVAETFNVEEHEPAWGGLMPDYTIPSISNSYLSTLLAGILGFLIVLGIAFVLGKTITKRNS